MAMGDALATEVQRVLAEHNISVDVVIPVCGYFLDEIFHLYSSSSPRCQTPLALLH